MWAIYENKKIRFENFVQMIFKEKIILQNNQNRIYLKKNCENIFIEINKFVLESGYWCNVKNGDNLEIKYLNRIYSAYIFEKDKNYSEIESDKNDFLLPFCNPTIKTYPYFTAIVGTIEAYNNSECWIYNNYILIWIMGKIQNVDYWADFKYGNEKIQDEFCKLINKEIISRNKVRRKHTDIVNFIKEAINKKKYVFLSVDTYYIREWWGNRPRKHFRHQVYIYGYNDHKKYIVLADFLENGIYKKLNVSYVEFIQAYNGFSEAPKIYRAFGEKNWLLSYNNLEEKIDLVRIKKLLKDFLVAKDTYVKSYLWKRKRIDQLKYGIDYYDRILEVLNDDCKIDYRLVHILLELNKVMELRMKFLEDNGYIILSKRCKEKLHNLVNETTKLQNLVIKYRINNNYKYFNEIRIRIMDLKKMQYDTFSKCYREL